MYPVCYNFRNIFNLFEFIFYNRVKISALVNVNITRFEFFSFTCLHCGWEEFTDIYVPGNSTHTSAGPVKIGEKNLGHIWQV